MPVYRFTCEEGHINDNFFRVSRRPDEIDCQEESCDLTAERDIVSEAQQKNPHIFEEYFDEHLATEENPEGTFVTDRSQKRRLKKRLGLREKGSFVE